MADLVVIPCRPQMSWCLWRCRRAVSARFRPARLSKPGTSAFVRSRSGIGPHGVMLALSVSRRRSTTRGADGGSPSNQLVCRGLNAAFAEAGLPEIAD